MTQAAVSAALLFGAVALVLVGTWGRRRAADLVPPGLAAEDRERQIRVIRRGARACFVTAGLFLPAALGPLL